MKGVKRAKKLLHEIEQAATWERVGRGT